MDKKFPDKKLSDQENTLNLLKGGFKKKLQKVQRQDSLTKSGRRRGQAKQDVSISLYSLSITYRVS